MSQLTNHLSKLKTHAELVHSGIPSSQATRIVFNIDAEIKMAETPAEHDAVISLSLTKCVQNYLNQLTPEELDEFVIRLELTKCNGRVNSLFRDEDGVWEIETGTFDTISLGNLSFDARLIFLSVLEQMLQ